MVIPFSLRKHAHTPVLRAFRECKHLPWHCCSRLARPFAFGKQRWRVPRHRKGHRHAPEIRQRLNAGQLVVRLSIPHVPKLDLARVCSGWSVASHRSASVTGTKSRAFIARVSASSSDLDAECENATRSALADQRT